MANGQDALRQLMDAAEERRKWSGKLQETLDALCGVLDDVVGDAPLAKINPLPGGFVLARTNDGTYVLIGEWHHSGEYEDHCYCDRAGPNAKGCFRVIGQPPRVWSDDHAGLLSRSHRVEAANKAREIIEHITARLRLIQQEDMRATSTCEAAITEHDA